MGKYLRPEDTAEIKRAVYAELHELAITVSERNTEKTVERAIAQVVRYA